jgi:phosphate transport system substrate-binding protein
MNRQHLLCSIFAATLSCGIAHASTPITLNGGGSSLAYPTYTADFSTYTASKSSDLFSYEAVGSGAGQKAFLGNNIGYFEPYNASTNTVGYQPGTLTYGTIVGTQVDFGASDAFLSSTQLTDPATGSYTESSVDGPLIQVPTIGTPITMAYINSDASSVTLTSDQICGVLSGKITDWNALVPSIPAGTETINVVVRSDVSGTTFLTSQFLKQECTSSNSSFPEYPVPLTKYFYNSTGSSSPIFPNGLPSNFTGESGSGGVASEMQTLGQSFAYLSPDYTNIAADSANNTYGISTASVVNPENKKLYSPNVTNTTLGLAHPDASVSTNPNPPNSMSTASNPLNWVPAIPVTTQGYPIVGYTTMDLSSCYASKSAGSLLINILKDIYKKTGTYGEITTNNGFVPLVNSGAAKFYTAIADDFLSNKSHYGLDIDDATTCASYTGR